MKALLAVLSISLLLITPGASLAEEQDSEGPVLPAAQETSRARARGEVVLDKVLATVDGEPLTASDLRRHIMAQGGTPPEDLREVTPEVRRHLQELVAENMLTKEAESSGITVADDEIDAYIEEIKRQNGVDEEGFKAILAERGLTFEDYLTQVRQDIVRARVMSAKVRSKINVLDEDIERYLEDRPELLPQEGTVRLHQIFFRYTAEAPDETRARLEEVRQRLAAEGGSSAKWRELGAENYTDLGYVAPRELRTEFKEAIAGLEQGELSEVVDTADGAYIFMVSSTANESKADKSLKEEIRKELYEARFKKEVDTFLNEELPKKYHVEFKI